MAQITIQDVLGSDNVGASRAVIQANTKVLCDAINKIETYLNTTPNGGNLNIADILVKKYSQSIDTDILRVEASARIDGNLTIYKKIVVGTGIAGEVSIFNSDLTVSRQFTVNRSQNSSYETLYSIFNSGISINDIFVLGGKYIHPITDQLSISVLNVLGFVAPTLPLVTGKNNLVFSWAVTSLIGSPPAPAKVLISDGLDGQVLFITNTGTAPSNGSIEIVHVPDGTSTEQVIASFNNITDLLLPQISMIIMFDDANGVWKVMSITKPVGVSCPEYA